MKKNNTSTPAVKTPPPPLTVEADTLLMPFLLSSMPGKNRHNIKTLLGNKQVLVNGAAALRHDDQLKAGDVVSFEAERIPREKNYRGFSIIHEDHSLIVIDKHAGTLSMGTDTQKDNTAYSMLSRHVKEQDPDNRIFIVHRLDRDTSGLMVFAKNEEVKLEMQQTWTETVTERTYVAVVEGLVEKTRGTITSYLKETDSMKVYSSQNPAHGVKAITHYKVLKATRFYSLLELQLETGRKNQIRVHMQDIGHSIAGDKKYGAKTNPIRRLALHARVLAFNHPITGEALKFETGLPRKFLRFFE